MNADLEDCFADDPAGVAATITAAARPAPPARRSRTSSRDGAIHPTRRWRPSASRRPPRRRGPPGSCSRPAPRTCIRGVRDLDDTIARLQAYQEAGADVLYAPGLFSIDDVRTVVTSVDRPVNVILLAGRAVVAELAAAGVGPSRSAARWRGWRGAPSPRRPASCCATARTGYADARQGRRQGGARRAQLTVLVADDRGSAARVLPLAVRAPWPWRDATGAAR